LLAWFWSCSAAWPATAQKLEPLVEGSAQRREFIQAVRQLVTQEDFATLDLMAEKLWRERSRLPEGVWKLTLFYTALNVSSANRAKADWPGAFARFERWQKARPESASAKIGHAEALTAYAWQARGGGYANTVNDESWKLFAERLQQARKLLDSDPALKGWPGYYETMMTVALGQGWRRSEYDRLFAAAVKLAPDYETFYFRKAYFLQPKWFGTSEDEWHRFAIASAKSLEKEHGQSFYTRIVWATIGSGPTSKVAAMKKQRIDWPRMRQGFQDLAREYPDSLWNQNAFCYYACAAQDRATARELFQELKGRYASTLWGGAESFRKAQAWAMAEGP
jgi:hypothetical protein